MGRKFFNILCNSAVTPVTFLMLFTFRFLCSFLVDNPVPIVMSYCGNCLCLHCNVAYLAFRVPFTRFRTGSFPVNNEVTLRMTCCRGDDFCCLSANRACIYCNSIVRAGGILRICNPVSMFMGFYGNLFCL